MKISRAALPRLALLLIALVVLLAAGTRSASAHAELVSTDPPINGLVVASPEQLVLNFTEEVAANDPPPSVRVLDADGAEVAVTVLPPEGRTLRVDVPTLSPGVWTVSWSVRSATDGHLLSGTYAFRVGGGIPAGAATVEGETPDPWGVLTRWLTFLGAGITAAGFLFALVDRRDRIPSRRLTAIGAGAATGLLASLAEPLIVQRKGEGDAGLGQAVRSMPDGWWYRPPAFALALVAVFVLAYLLRRRANTVLLAFGAIVGLVPLLGLSLTSHAAGRDSLRDLAVASDLVHQISVALWVGGLIHLLLSWPFPDTLNLRRFSRAALVLFGVGVATGIANAGFVFPAIDDLWSSDYGYVLIVKVLVLLIPFAMAVLHHRAVIKGVTALFRTTLRLEVIAVIAVVAGGAILALSAPPVESLDGPERLTLVQLERDAAGEAIGLVHLRVEPATNGDNAIELWLTDTMGQVPAGTEAPGVSLAFTSLDHGTSNADVGLQPVDPAARRYRAEGLDLSLNGWWQIDARVDRPEGATSTRFLVLLPDPNIHGSDAAPSPDDDPAARAIFDKAIATMEAQPSLAWTEAINTGNDTVVSIDWKLVADVGGQGMGFEQFLRYSATFVPRADGSTPAPTFDSYHSIAIGEEAWLLQPDGTVLSQPAGNVAPIAEWGDIYDLATYLHLGATMEMNGEPVQVITFHTPEEPGQAKAWFAWWVGTETGYVYQMGMVAAAHYMTWDYRDFGLPITLEPPPGAD